MSHEIRTKVSVNITSTFNQQLLDQNRLIAAIEEAVRAEVSRWIQEQAEDLQRETGSITQTTKVILNGG